MKIKGTKGADYLIGTAEADIIKGGKGRDVLDGRGGADILTGGKGADTFIFRHDQIDVDRVTDFKPGVDTIVVEVDGNLVPAYGAGVVYTADPASPPSSPTGIIATLDGSPATSLFDARDLIGV